MKVNKTVLLVTINTLVILAIIEVASYLLLSSQGIQSSLFVTSNTQIEGARDDKFNVIDPHLAYAHGANESRVERLSSDFTWMDGFVVYAKNVQDIRTLQRPVILTLGGSTTDGVNYDHSWPEHMARMLREGGMPGTVVNGGTGGYSTNQELLKLTRDGLEFKPDLVISYSGINDRGRYSALPHPMTHSYQRNLLDTLTRSAQSPLLPSTVSALQLLGGADAESRISYTLGIATDRTLGQQYERNMQLMHAISESQGAEFIGFIQPYGYFRNADGALPEKDRGLHYRSMVIALYDEITRLPSRLEYMRDATKILDDHPDVFKPDRVHLLDKGDEIVAKHVLSEIQPLLTSIPSTAR